ncbi:MAG: sel1 repeat family protein [Synergistaceae bacterium]|nr:sel1 repeat family protein [Synergistaceae bacterium]
MKNAGDERIIPRLKDCMIESVSKADARKLIRQNTFSMKTIEARINGMRGSYSYYKHSYYTEVKNEYMTIIITEPVTVNESDLGKLQDMAEAGHPLAQYMLGKFYDDRNNFPMAYIWYMEAALQGNSDAQNALGELYEDGLGVRQDYRKAFEWYLKAAEHGEVRAQNSLGRMYKDGKGVYRNDENYRTAFLWFEKAANNSSIYAKYNLACMYENGLGVKRDINKAIEFYIYTCQYFQEANLNLGDLYVSLLPSLKKKSEKQSYINKARDCYNKAIELAESENDYKSVNEAKEQLAKLSRIKIQ